MSATGEAAAAAQELPPSVCAASDHQQTILSILTVLTVVNIVLLFLVGLLARLTIHVNKKLNRLLKTSSGRAGAPLKPMTPAKLSTDALDAVASPEDVTKELVTGHVRMIRRTLSNQSLRSSLSADDFAALQCMLGEEDGVTM